MSLLMTTENGWIISHLNYLNKIYNTVLHENKSFQLEFNEKFFAINSQFKRKYRVMDKLTDEKTDKCKKIRKRKHTKECITSSFKYSDEVEYINCKLNVILCEAAEKKLFIDIPQIDYNRNARQASHEFYDTSYDIPFHLYGGNQSENCILTKIGTTEYVIPQKCKFYSYDIENIHKILGYNNKYDFILMDPPWWNKFIRRNKKTTYKMMFNDTLCEIPVNNLLNSDGIIGIWCTNSESHLTYILNVIFPKWGMKFIARWYWVKITQSGEPICNFSKKSGKQPYELLIFGGFLNSSIRIPDKKLLVSVPSAIHSHKPPITDVMKTFLPPSPNCLEIFARYLLPNWTSWGLEVLRLQQRFLYVSK